VPATPVELVVAPEAELDLAEAYGWYEGRRIGLGEEFLSSVDACLESIRRWPGMYAVVHEDFRRALIRRFPYAVFYEVREATVTIYAVFHTSRDPGKWRRRLSG
jgi:plasmid stabilization system protein ParE